MFVLRFGGEELAGAIERSERHVGQLCGAAVLDDDANIEPLRVEEAAAAASAPAERLRLPWPRYSTAAPCSVARRRRRADPLVIGFRIEDASRTMMLSVADVAVSRSSNKAFQLAAGIQRRRASSNLASSSRNRPKPAGNRGTDRTMPTGTGHLVQRLEAAETELAELAQLAPLTYQRQSIQEEAQAADRQVSLAVQQLKDARRRWKASLRAVGLPDSLTPAQIGQVSGRVGQFPDCASDWRTLDKNWRGADKSWPRSAIDSISWWLCRIEKKSSNRRTISFVC